MTMMEDKRCMIDTNVLVYSIVDSSPKHKEARDYLTLLAENNVELCITFQIAREFLVILTRGNVFESNFTVDEALIELESILLSMSLLDENNQSFQCLLELISRYGVKGKKIHDTNIVALMITHGIKRLVTYNIKDFTRFDEIILDPIT
jgi:predicted nucleic acid-binding protein